MCSQFATCFSLLFRTKDRVSLNHLLSSLIFTHNKLLDVSINNMQEYALIYNCSSWALTVNWLINPLTGLYRYYNYIGGFLHLCFRYSLLHMLIIFVKYSCRHCFLNCLLNHRQCCLFWNFVTNLIWSQLALNLAFWMKTCLHFHLFSLPYFRWMDFA